MVSPAAALAIMGALVVVGGLLFWPPWGLCWQWRRLVEVGRRARMEDALKHLHHYEFSGVVATLESVAGALAMSRDQTATLVAQLEGLGLLRASGPGYALTAEGRRTALRVIRVHRLWEKYLAEYTGVQETQWHDRADRHEHFLSDSEAEALAASMGNPRFDPHGAPIPTATGEVGPARGQPLNTLEVGQPAVISHVEDEPEAVYAQLTAQGLGVGVRVRVLESSPQRIGLEADGEEQVLAPVVAGNVTVTRLQEAIGESLRKEASARLSGLGVGQRAQVVAISSRCYGLQRRRLLDLGLVPGTIVGAELQRAGGDPTAYRIRGALIALRKAQADQVFVNTLAKEA